MRDVFLLVLLSLQATAAEPSTAAAAGTAPAAPAAVRFVTNLEAARAEAREKKRPLLLNFHTRWCGWCRKMDRETFRDSRVAGRAEKDAVFVSHDAEDGAAGTRLARSLRVGSFPTMVVVDADLKEVDRIRGYKPPDQFLAELDGILRKPAQIETLLERARSEPGDPQVLFDVASELERARREEAAAKMLESLLALSPAKSKDYRDLALWKLAQLSIRLGQPEQAIERLQTLLKEFPEGEHAEDATYNLAVLHQRAGSVAEALEAYDRFVEKFPASRRVAAARTYAAQLRTRPATP